MPLFDAHCHLQDALLRPHLDGLMADARAAGVDGWSCCAVVEEDWDDVLAIADATAGVVPSLGLHPVFLRTRRAGWLDRLAARLAARPEAAVGEVGLDLAREGLVPVEEQEAVLWDQVGLARDLGRPLTIHGVRAWPRIVALLRAFGPHPAGVVCHAFGGPNDVIGPLAALGASFSFPASVTRNRPSRVHAAARAVPLERLLAETDAPDFAPLGTDAVGLERDADGRLVNVPRTLPLVVAALAAIRGEDPTVTGEATARNAHALLARGAGR